MSNQGKLSRKDFIKLSGSAALSLALSACGVPQADKATMTPEVPNTSAPEATAAVPTAVPAPGRVTIPATEQLSITSSAVGHEYRISVALPDSYIQKPDAHYPVLYVLDANSMFGMVTEIVRIFTFSQSLNDIIVVGIGYPVDTFLETVAFRTRDMTPTLVDGWYDNNVKPETPGAPDDAGTGGAAAFLKFIRDELMPVINKNYRTDPGDSGILGHSLGGLFGLYTLFAQPESFQHYILGSASIWWDNYVIRKAAEAFAANQADIPAKVFFSVGSREGDMVNDMLNIVELLKEKDKQSRGLKIASHIFDSETHPSVLPSHISRGLRTVYPYYG